MIREKVLFPFISSNAYYKFQLNKEKKGQAIVEGNSELLIELANLKCPEKDLGAYKGP